MALKWLTPPAAPDLEVVADGYIAPSMHPLPLVTVMANQTVAYEHLFTDVDANGAPRVVFHPGTFGMLIAAGRGWRS